MTKLGLVCDLHKLLDSLDYWTFSMWWNLWRKKILGKDKQTPIHQLDRCTTYEYLTCFFISIVGLKLLFQKSY